MSTLPTLADMDRKFDILFNHGLLDWGDKCFTPSKRYDSSQVALCDKDDYRPNKRFLTVVKLGTKRLAVKGTTEGIVLTAGYLSLFCVKGKLS